LKAGDAHTHEAYVIDIHPEVLDEVAAHGQAAAEDGGVQQAVAEAVPDRPQLFGEATALRPSAHRPRRP
jgi:hypothetical protein